MTLDQFRRTLAQATPPPSISAPVEALWWAAKGDWERAHMIVMDDISREAAWVHAHLHRQEGDLSNAQYWYARAGQAPASGPPETEWQAIAGALI
jgi:hypothetical protein